MGEQMRNVNLSVDEIKDLMDWLSPEHDGGDFESECPSCTSYRKLSAALSQPAAQVDSSHSAGGECGGLTQWKPIETAPKDGILVLAYWDTVLDGEQVTGDGCYAMTRWDGVEWASQDDPGITFADPTHWMPIPAAPKVTNA